MMITSQLMMIMTMTMIMINDIIPSVYMEQAVIYHSLSVTFSSLSADRHMV